MHCNQYRGAVWTDRTDAIDWWHSELRFAYAITQRSTDRGVAASSAAINYDDVISKMRGRLAGAAPNAVFKFDEVASTVTISDWGRNAARIQGALAIDSQVQLAWLITASDESGERTWLPLAGKVPLAGLATGTQGLSTTLATARPLINVKSDWVAAVTAKSESLSIELTRAGRELLAETRSFFLQFFLKVLCRYLR